MRGRCLERLLFAGLCALRGLREFQGRPAGVFRSFGDVCCRYFTQDDGWACSIVPLHRFCREKKVEPIMVFQAALQAAAQQQRVSGNEELTVRWCMHKLSNYVLYQTNTGAYYIQIGE